MKAKILAIATMLVLLTLVEACDQDSGDSTPEERVNAFYTCLEKSDEWFGNLDLQGMDGQEKVYAIQEIGLRCYDLTKDRGFYG